jgi:hypothetical protein
MPLLRTISCPLAVAQWIITLVYCRKYFPQRQKDKWKPVVSCVTYGPVVILLQSCSRYIVRLYLYFGITLFLHFAHRLVYKRTHSFGKFICCRPHVKWWKARTQLSPFGSNYNNRVQMCSLEYQTMRRFQNPSNHVCYTIVRTSWNIFACVSLIVRTYSSNGP